MGKLKTKTIVSSSGIIALLSWHTIENSDLANKVWVNWHYPLSQDPIDARHITHDHVTSVQQFCDKNGLTLWSY